MINTEPTTSNADANPTNSSTNAEPQISQLPAIGDGTRESLNRLGSWLRTYSYMIFYITLGLLIVVLLVVWINTSISFTAGALERHVLTDRANDVTIQIEYPAKLFFAAQPADLQINVLSQAVITQPITITTQFSEEIGPQPLIPQANSLSAQLVFTSTGPIQTAAIPLRNTGVWQAYDFSIGQITITSSLGHTFPVLEIGVEGTKRAAWRQFLTNTVNEKSPLILGVAALAAAIPALLQYYQKRREEIRAMAQQHGQAEKLGDELRRYLCQANKQGAEEIHKQITAQRLHKETLPTNWHWMEKLLAIANGRLIVHGEVNQDLLGFAGNIQSSWPPELMGSLVCAEGFSDGSKFSSLKPESVLAIRNLFREFPLDKVADAKLKDAFVRMWRKAQDLEMQSWRTEPKPAPDKLFNHKPRNYERLLGDRQIFLSDKAEWEQKTLFRQGTFYEPPFYPHLFKVSENLLIHGEKGCGRTALALALYTNHNTESPDRGKLFAVYSSGTADFPIMQLRLAEQLLRYVSEVPTLLADLSEAERNLFAALFAQTLKPRYCEAYIDALIQRGNWHSNETVQVSKPEETRKFWQIVGDTQLTLLKQAILSAEAQNLMDETTWLRSLVHCAQSLGFAGVRMIIDLSSDLQNPQEIPVWPQLLSWTEFGFVTTLFTPSEMADEFVNGFKSVESIRISWSEEQIREMARQRFERSPRRKLENYFVNDNAVDRFIRAAAGNPRRLGQLWRLVIEEMEDEDLITDSALARAISKFR